MQLDQYVGSVITGKQLNDTLGPIPLLKFMNNDDKHYDLQYKDGINYDILPFDSMHECAKGGIYVTSIEY